MGWRASSNAAVGSLLVLVALAALRRAPPEHRAEDAALRSWAPLELEQHGAPAPPPRRCGGTLREAGRAWVEQHGGREEKGGDTLRYAHMASAALLPSGTVLAAFQASALYEGAADQRIYVSASRDGSGLHWSPPEAVFGGASGGAEWAPALVAGDSAPHGAAAALFFARSSRRECLRPAQGKRPELWAPGGDILVAELDASGDWAAPRVVLAEKDVPNVIANPPVRTAAGALVLPYWTEKKTLPAACQRDDAEEYAGVLVSHDDGETWEAHGRLTAPGTHLIEGAVAERADGSLLMLFRTARGAAYASASADGGLTWSEPTRTTMSNPDSKLAMLGSPGLGLIAAYNDHKSFADAGCRKCRTRLVLARSGDGGATWVRATRLEGGTAKREPDYLKNHYPSLLPLDGCRLLVLYSRDYSCCAPANAQLGVRAVVLELV